MADFTKAKAHILVLLSQLEEVYNISNIVYNSYDLDTASGRELDIIGKIVGVGRRVQELYTGGYFGFDNNSNSGYIADKSNTSITNLKKLKNKIKSEMLRVDLNDDDYRILIKAKITKNNTDGMGLVSEDRMSILNALDWIFNGKVNLDIYNTSMKILVKIDTSFSSSVVYHLKELDLLPRPYGVTFDIVQEAI